MELNKEQADRYQSYYCGLCQALKHVSGVKGQLLLNYDMTFLALLLTGLYEPYDEVDTFTCPLHPLHKKTSNINPAVSYAAKMNILLSYHALMDAWKDDHSFVKKTMADGLYVDYMNIKEQCPRQAAAIENYIQKQDLCESGNETNLDAVSGLTGQMMAELFDWKQDQWSQDLRDMGFYLGKFIYLLDAYVDLESDTKKGLYNPFRHIKENNGATELDFDTYVKLILTSMMSECAKSFERLPIVTHSDLLRNILYSGVWNKFESINNKSKESK